MAGSSIDDELKSGASGNTVRKELAEHLAHIELRPMENGADISDGNVIKLPFNRLPALGVGLAELGGAFRDAMQQPAGEMLYRVILPDGATLRQAKDGLFSSAARAVDGSAAWAKYQQVLPTAQSATAFIDPTVLAMAIALSQITQKLDAIQDTQKEMFDYLRQKDKADLLGNLRTLTDLYNDYRYNWNNDMWLKNAHMKVMDIKQESDKSSDQLRGLIASKLKKHGPLDVRATIEQRLNEVLDQLKDYQLSTYLFAFSSFLEPMLSTNFDEAYLSSIVERISEHALRYREMYSACYDEIERESEDAIDAVLLGGVSAAGKAFGSFLSSTPIGAATPIGEAISDAGGGVGRFNNDLTDGLMKKLQAAKSPDVMPFQQALESVNALYNQPVYIAADNENMYVLQAAA